MAASLLAFLLFLFALFLYFRTVGRYFTLFSSSLFVEFYQDLVKKSFVCLAFLPLQPQVHGDKAQGDRDAALASFVANQTPLMFATDVAARGLDIKKVTHVVNFDMARDVESYVHRIGRTGRAGEVGESVTFWNPDYDKACAPVRSIE